MRQEAVSNPSTCGLNNARTWCCWLPAIVLFALCGTAGSPANAQSPPAGALAAVAPSPGSVTNAPAWTVVPVASLDEERQALLSEWETRLRADAYTTKLEAIEPGRYRFQTTRFPYDGELVVVNVAIEEMAGWGDADATMGVIEVQLPGIDPQFYERHGQSYGFWAQGNLLYHDGEKWLAADEWADVIQNELSGKVLTSINWTWIAILVGFAVFVWLVIRRTNQQIKRSLTGQDEALSQQRVAMEQQRISMERQALAIDLTQRSLALFEKQTQILDEILEELKKSA